VGKGVTLEILPGGNLTNTRFFTNNGTIVINGGILKNIDGYIYNFGRIYHNSGTFANYGFVENNPQFEVRDFNPTPGQIVNRAIIKNYNSLQNHGNLTNLGVIENTGEIQFFGGSTVYNNGTISNLGRIDIAGAFDNEKYIENSGTMVIYLRLQSSPQDDFHLVVDNFGEIVNTVGEIHNNSIINNYGTLSNQIGEIVNRWDEARAVINNAGTISNIAGKIINEGIIDNNCIGKIEGNVLGNAPSDICAI